MDSLVDEIALSALRLKTCWQLENGSEAYNGELPPNASKELHAARQALIESSWQLHQKALGPKEYILSLLVAVQYTGCLKWLCRYSVFAAVPLDGSISYSQLSAAISAPEGALKSVARMAITSGLFTEPTPDHLAHSPISAAFVSNPDFLLWAEFMTEVSAPTAAEFAEATQRWPGSRSLTETAYNVAYGTDLSLFEHMKTVPKRTEQFAGYMRSVTNSEGTNLKHLVSGYDWAKLGQDALVVDIGGSTGHGSIALANQFPGLRFLVQDLATNADQGRSALEAANNKQNLDLAARISFQAYDFFEPQPVKGADVYLLRMIIHDWADDDSVRILSRAVQAMEESKQKSKLIIMDTVLPRSGEFPATQERLLRLRDLTMRQAFNSNERPPEEWAALLARVDPRLKLIETNKPFGSVLSVMVWELDDSKVDSDRIVNGVATTSDAAAVTVN